MVIYQNKANRLVGLTILSTYKKYQTFFLVFLKGFTRRHRHTMLWVERSVYDAWADSLGRSRKVCVHNDYKSGSRFDRYLRGPQ